MPLCHQSTAIMGRLYATLCGKPAARLVASLNSLFPLRTQESTISEEEIIKIIEYVKFSKLIEYVKIKENEVDYLVYSGNVKNEAYRADKIHINIVFKDGGIIDIAKASDQLNIDVLAKTVKKYYLCYPKKTTLIK